MHGRLADPEQLSDLVVGHVTGIERPDHPLAKVQRVRPPHRRLPRRLPGAGDQIRGITASEGRCEEIKVSGKGWFRELWARSPGFDPAAPVWRLEFQLRRTALRSFRVGGQQLSTLAEVEASAGPLWRILSSRWLAVRHRSADTRQALAPTWAALHAEGFAGGSWNGCTENLYRVAREESGGRSVAQFTGHLRRELAAHSYRTGVPADLSTAAPRILERAQSFAARRGSTLEQDANALADEWRRNERTAVAGPAPFRGAPIRVYRLKPDAGPGAETTEGDAGQGEDPPEG